MNLLINEEINDFSTYFEVSRNLKVEITSKLQCKELWMIIIVRKFVTGFWTDWMIINYDFDNGSKQFCSFSKDKKAFIYLNKIVL